MKTSIYQFILVTQIQLNEVLSAIFTTRSAKQSATFALGCLSTSDTSYGPYQFNKATFVEGIGINRTSEVVRVAATLYGKIFVLNT
jgi:hypothetical protein